MDTFCMRKALFIHSHDVFDMVKDNKDYGGGHVSPLMLSLIHCRWCVILAYTPGIPVYENIFY